MFALGFFLVPVISGYYLGLGVMSWGLGALVFAGYYIRDVRRRPRVPCRICTGSGSDPSHIGGRGWFRRPFGDCWCCGGKKAHPRLALRIVNPDAYRKIRGEIGQAKGKT